MEGYSKKQWRNRARRKCIDCNSVGGVGGVGGGGGGGGGDSSAIAAASAARLTPQLPAAPAAPATNTKLPKPLPVKSWPMRASSAVNGAQVLAERRAVNGQVTSRQKRGEAAAAVGGMSWGYASAAPGSSPVGEDKGRPDAYQWNGSAGPTAPASVFELFARLRSVITLPASPSPSLANNVQSSLRLGVHTLAGGSFLNVLSSLV